MKPSIYFITLVAKNAIKSIDFYGEGLGLELAAKGPKTGELAYAKFDVQPGLSLVIVSEPQFAEFTNMQETGARASQIILSIPKTSAESVAATYENALKKGGRPLMPPKDREAGFSASILDPDQNIIELIVDQDLPEIELA